VHGLTSHAELYANQYRLANFTLKLVRPGFGPAAELPTLVASATASRRLQFATRFCECHRRQPARRSGFGTRDRPHSLA